MAIQDVPVTEEAKQARQMENVAEFLKVFGVAMPTGFQQLLDRSAETADRARYLKLMTAANYGVAAPRSLPSEDVLKKMAAAAKAGTWIPPEALVKPKGDRALAECVKQMAMSAHPAIWHRFLAPATVLNELWQLAQIASDSTMGKEAAEASAIEYVLKMRAHLTDQARFCAVDSEAFQSKVKEAWHERSPVVWDEARQTGPGRANRPGSSREGQHFCLWHQIHKCTNTKCTLAHTCPFCGKAQAGCLAVNHLATLKTPRQIVVKGPGGQQPGQTPGGKGTKGKAKYSQNTHKDAPRLFPWEGQPRNQGKDTRDRSRSRRRSPSAKEGKKRKRSKS